ncbi:Thiol-disulfide isomerase or thioredoxin [Lutibacter oricola]|uniref:Thiol-disulfide isomerase or thioredoxin n=1 Tax=Lutibacter oricola TaxID=762486 RepID=A0A1H3AEI9_9FLAO|nr:TlpA disulfide reductase family protein [Lutibacter oricola]SDX28120.1 Thiol-disulfide isomerase or thioredoxin [Lutibacter oricola]
MRKISILVIAVATLFVACEEKLTDYAKVSGTLKTDAKEVTIKGREYTKTIAVDENGNFSDTLKVKADFYLMSTANGERTSLFLKNGYNITLNQKEETFEKGFTYSGEGKESNSYFSNLIAFFAGDNGNPKEYFKLDEAAYAAKVKESKELLNAYSKVGVDSLVLTMVENNNKQFFNFVESSYKREHDNLIKFSPGKVSPEFVNYENFKGGKTSLKDLRGKFVYIDVWATWCGPCIREIPSLKKLEEELHGKNIEFVSISVDNVDGKRGSHDAWKKMVAKEQLGGIQLYADKDFSSDFIRAYGVNSIPRFILIDDKGNIVDSNANRPSNPKLKEQLLELGI